jgi:pantoate--beta-alanine ligase
MADMIQKEPLARIDYVSVANPVTLEEISTVEGQVLLSMAVFFGDVRLIDNALIN